MKWKYLAKSADIWKITKISCWAYIMNYVAIWNNAKLVKFSSLAEK
jgi:hypothetical protein